LKPIDQFDLVQCLQTPKFEGLTSIPVDSDGKPLFQTPWQVQIFATVIFLTEKGIFGLEEFRTKLNFEIESAIETVDEPETYLASNYYQFWLITLEALLAERGICLQEELKAESPEQFAYC
jgi:nitrile hydratase accessory protein